MYCSARTFLFAASLAMCALSGAQQTPVHGGEGGSGAAPTLTAAGPGIWRVEGQDNWSGVRFVRLLLLSSRARPETETASQPELRVPTLTGQCTQDSRGKLFFELFANFGGVPDARFYPPWHPSAGDLYPPSTRKVTLTMEFLGYTKVKPFKRQFEEVGAPGPEQLRYLNPGSGSSNMEPPGWFFQYLRSLPTLRLSEGARVAEFETAGWLAQLHQEPLCKASGA